MVAHVLEGSATTVRESERESGDIEIGLCRVQSQCLWPPPFLPGRGLAPDGSNQLKKGHFIQGYENP